MEKFISLFVSIMTMFTQLFGLTGNVDYQKQTNLKDLLYLISHKKEITSEYHYGNKDGAPWSPEDTFSLDDTSVIIKEKDKDFVILNLTDLHFEDFGTRSVLSIEGEATMRRMVATTSPDLITLSGDLVCGESDVYSIKRITDIMESFGIPWAPMFGNHDDEANCDLDYLCDIMMKGPHCLMKKGDPEMGYGNYVINIAEKDEDEKLNIVSSVIVMDSHHSQPNAKQQEWLKWVTGNLNDITNGTTEISVFMHIPIPEYQYAYDLAWDKDARKWRDGYGAYGSLHEKICCERDGEGNPVQRGLFDILKNANVKYVFCGHEHMNDFSIVYDGIRLTYMMKLGYGSGYQIGFNGATKITVGDTGIKNITHYTISFGPKIPLVNIEVK